MIWIILIVIFVLPIILGFMVGVKSNEIANAKDSDVDWWTLGALADMHNKYEDSKRK